MHRDGRFTPLEVLAQGIALAGVLGTAAVAWWRSGSRRHWRAYDAAGAAVLHQRLVASLPFTIETPEP